MKSRGFTLIELMVVIAIVGILVAIALPTYQNYIVRSRITEAFSLASATKVAVSEYRNTQGVFPSDNAQAGINAVSSPNVQSITVGENGVITVALADVSQLQTARNTSIQFTPTLAGDVVRWQCRPAPANGTPAVYLPSDCRP